MLDFFVFYLECLLSFLYCLLLGLFVHLYLLWYWMLYGLSILWWLFMFFWVISIIIVTISILWCLYWFFGCLYFKSIHHLGTCAIHLNWDILPDCVCFLVPYSCLYVLLLGGYIFFIVSLGLRGWSGLCLFFISICHFLFV